MTQANQLINFDATTQKNLDAWLNGEYDEETKKTLKKLIQDSPKEIVDAFYTNLTFGTGGLRGIMGLGSNRLNVYTVRAATQGLANYILQQPLPENGYSVFIGYDPRKNSKLFSEEAAKVLAGNGIKAYLSKDLRPTPLVSFGCRYYKCTAAIMVTASHNPPEYNGYKVYWSDGAQVLPPHDKGIISEVEKIIEPSQVKIADLKDPLISLVGEELDNAYMDATVHLQMYPENNQSFGKQLKVIYSNLHGTGAIIVPKVLNQWGFTNHMLVKEQEVPDGNFPTVKYPNPEDKNALVLGIEVMKKNSADIFIATDPDADRVGIAVFHQGNTEILTGNQIACICLEHICQALKTQNRLPSNAAFIKTYPTTELFHAIANSYGKSCFDVHTGFKYIAQQIREWESFENPPYQYIFGGEESYGYLLGTEVRDKDAVIASALLCEVALCAKLDGKTLIDLLHDIYNKYGVYVEKLLSVNFEESKAGKEKMAASMQLVRKNPPKEIGNLKVLCMEDFISLTKYNLTNNTQEPINYSASDMVIFRLENGGKLIIRPSGTEPKVKLYCGVIKPKYSNLYEALRECEQQANHLLQFMKKVLEG